MPDFRVQRGMCTISGAGTASNIVPIQAVDTAKAFIRLTGGHDGGIYFKGTSGAIGQGANNLFGGNPVFASSSGVQVTRQNGATAVAADRAYYYWEVIEYTGSPGGPNEFAVSYFNTLTTSTLNVAVVVPGVTLANMANEMVIVCGVSNNLTVQTVHVRSWIVAYVDFGIAILLGNRANNLVLGFPDTASVTLASVTLIGSNWKTKFGGKVVVNNSVRAYASTSDPLFTPVSGVDDWNHTWAELSYRTTAAAGVPQACRIFYPGSGDLLLTGLATFAQADNQASGNTWDYNLHYAQNDEMNAVWARSNPAANISGDQIIGWTNDPDGPTLPTGRQGDPRPTAGDPSGVAPGLIDVIPRSAYDTFEPISGNADLVWTVDHTIAAGPAAVGLPDSSYKTWRVSDLAVPSGNLADDGTPRQGPQFTFRKQNTAGRNPAWSFQCITWPNTLSGAELCTTTCVDESLLHVIQSRTAALCVGVTLAGLLAPDGACDWFERGGRVWQSAADGAQWLKAGGGPWAPAVSGNDWFNPESGNWFDPKDCG